MRTGAADPDGPVAYDGIATFETRFNRDIALGICRPILLGNYQAR